MFSRAFACSLLLLIPFAGSASDMAGGRVPATARKPVTDEMHGVSITDNYRWLEDQQSPETRAWIKQQQQYADKFLLAIPGREETKQELTALLRIDRYELPIVRKQRQFFLRRPGDKNFNQICLRKGNGRDEVLIDANSLSTAAKPKTLQLMGVSEAGDLLAYGVREGGEDELTVKFFNVDARKDAPETMPRLRYTSFSLLLDASGFYYGRMVPAGVRIFFHKLGTDVSTDQVVFGNEYGPEIIIGAEVTYDGRWLIATAYRGAAKDHSEVFAMRLGRDRSPQPVITKLDAEFSPDYFNDHLYVTTTWKTPNRRVFSLDLNNPQQANWKDVVPEQADHIEFASVVGGKLFVSYLHNVSSQIGIYGLDGKMQGNLPLPNLGTVSSALGRPDQDDVFFEYQSFTVLPTIYRHNLANNQQTVWWAAPHNKNVDEMTVNQVWYESRDKTRVPMFIVHRKDLRLDGSARVLMTAYGGFDISMTPHFGAMAAYWVENGGVSALPNLRGGGEFGEAWHKAGMLEKKQNVFDDFEHAAEYLIKNGYTRPSRLGILGGSNGGLLMGAAVTQRPDLFGAVVCEFPLLDMIRYDRFKVAKWWVPEYGTAENKDQFAYLYKYSPYQHVEKGVRYPSILFVTGDADTRVDPLHARKMAALMQSATGSANPILLKYDTTAGHSGGQALDQEINDDTDVMSFLSYTLH
jgi:prolyl oligopeptidase